MPVDLLHTFPLTHKQAVDCLIESPWTPAEKDWVVKRTVTNLFHPLGNPMRKSWYLDNETFPLPRHYMKKHGIGDAGDMVALILFDFTSRLTETDFNMEAFLKSFRQNWIDQGLDPVTKARII